MEERFFIPSYPVLSVVKISGFAGAAGCMMATKETRFPAQQTAAKTLPEKNCFAKRGKATD
jgi:hypothetical protein